MNESVSKPKNARAHATPQSAEGIRVRDLNVTAGARDLLVDATADFEPGKITIIVGPSGVGKSILLRIIAGLLGRHGVDGIRYSGEVTVDSKPVKAGAVGVVFQAFALFDELSPKNNIRFAQDHDRKKGSVSIDELVQQLKIPTDVPTSRLSGGQRQRLAIARALAYNPPAILYDEPTSGLDPSTGRHVAQLIRDTHDEFQKTSVIVTHDYETLVPIADRVIVLDPSKKILEEVPPDQWDDLETLLTPMSKAVTQREEEKVTLENIFSRAAKGFFAGTTRCFESILLGLICILPIWKSIKWGARYLAHYTRLIAGPTAWFYLAMAGIIIGFVTTHFTFQFLPFGSYTEPLLDDDLLLAIGFSLYRIFVPIIATVLIAARCGAAVTSDVGSKQYGNQNDALLTFGVKPRAYLLTPIMICFLIGTPFLTLIAFFAAKYTSLIAFTCTHPDHGPDFWDFHFHRRLRTLGQPIYDGTWWLMLKLVSCGFGIGIISYFQGVRSKSSTTDVSRSVTATILWATLFVLTVHFIFAFFEFKAIGS